MLYYAIGLLVLFYVLLCLEVFLPSGGILGIGAAVAAIAAIVVAFNHSHAAGISVFILAAATTPPMIWGLLRVWPHTPIGRRMLNRTPGQRATVVVKTTIDGTVIESLVGHIGIAKSDLLPSGLILVDGVKLDAISLGMPIDSGDEVIITSVEAGRIHVRNVTDKDRTSAQDTPAQSPSSPQSPPSLEQSLDALDFD